MSELRIFIIAGEASGDALGAALMADLHAISPRTPVFAGAWRGWDAGMRVAVPV